MTLLPVIWWPLLLALAAAAVALVWAPLPVLGPRPARVAAMRRTALIGLLALAALRPGFAGGSTQAVAADLNVVFVIDTTASMTARDAGGGHSRLDAAKADMTTLADSYPGARFAVISFDRSGVVRMPLTTDTTALASSASLLVPEGTGFSTGSSVTVAAPMVQSYLASAAASHPERPNVVIYLGDGEQTAADPPEPFAIDRSVVQGAVVLGYGSTDGAEMYKTQGGATTSEVITDASGTPAISKINETELGTIAQQLGGAYLHRDYGAGVGPVVSALTVAPPKHSVAGLQGGVGRTELYWLPLIGVAALLAWEVADAGGALARAWRAQRELAGPASPRRAGRRLGRLPGRRPGRGAGSQVGSQVGDDPARRQESMAGSAPPSEPVTGRSR